MIYVTSTEAPPPSSFDAEAGHLPPSSSNSSSAAESRAPAVSRVWGRRPSVDREIQGHEWELCFACGPAALVEKTRLAVVSSQPKCEFHAESFEL